MICLTSDSITAMPFASTRCPVLRSVIGGALLLIPMLLLTGSARGQDTFRVAVVRYQHETCTFCPGGDTDVDDWTRIRALLPSEKILTGGNSRVAEAAGRAREVVYSPRPSLQKEPDHA